MFKNTYINFPVKDEEVSRNFFKQLGFSFKKEYEAPGICAMVINENTMMMLINEKDFSKLSTRKIVQEQFECIHAFEVDSKEKIVDLVNKAISLGAKPFNDLVDNEEMYYWGFTDLDNHIWEIVFIK